MTRKIQSIHQFAMTCSDILHKDNDIILATGGMTGKGKSTFSIQLQKAYSEIQKLPWSFEGNLTTSRDQVMTWITGENADDEPDPKTGLKKGQMPLYSAVLADEIILMFYNRKWADDGQINAIGDLNLFRDRRMLLCGNVPCFWRLDVAFIERVRFYVYIPHRGVAWVFQQAELPFSKDPWNRNINSMMGGPGSVNAVQNSPNFVCEIHFPDLDPEEKIEYKKIRSNLQLADKKNENEDNKYFTKVAIGSLCEYAGLTGLDAVEKIGLFGKSAYYSYIKLAKNYKAKKGEL